MNVGLQVQQESIGLVVRFQSETTSRYTGRTYMDTDLITIVKPDYEAALREDFEVYRQLDRARQLEVLNTLKWNRYEGRVIQDMPQEATPQLALF